MTRPLCDECGAEGIPDVKELEDGRKHVARECPECMNYWEYTVE